MKQKQMVLSVKSYKPGVSYVYLRKIKILLFLSTKLEEFVIYVYLGVLFQFPLSTYFPLHFFILVTIFHFLKTCMPSKRLEALF